MAFQPVQNTEDVESTNVYAGTVSYEIKNLLKWEREKYMTMGDGDSELSYESGRLSKFAVKFGQLKLLMSEILFFTLYWDPKKIPKPLCVYVGAAEGIHIKALSDMFPQFEYHLYDSRKFDDILNNVPNIEIFNRYFEDTDIQRYRNESNRIFFISDIRSLQYDSAYKTESVTINNEKLALADMLLQQYWVKELKPHKAYLKCRFPYKNDYTINTFPSLTIPYLAGVCWLQPWTSQTSTELRLVPNDDLSEQEWNFRKIEDIMCYHNKIMREMNRFENVFTGRDEAIYTEIGITNDWDSMYTVQIIRDYLTKFGVIPTEQRTKELLKFVCENANPKKSLFKNRSGESRYEED